MATLTQLILDADGTIGAKVVHDAGAGALARPGGIAGQGGGLAA